ncbi:MAG: hypothetical protein ACE15E_22935 [Acidobacteriota bacterium]
MPTVPGVPYRPYRSARFAFSSTNLSGGYFPGWGLPCSLLIHQIPLVLAVFFSTLPTPPPPGPPPPVTPSKPRFQIQWMYFPRLPAVSQSPAVIASKSASGKPSPAPSSAAARGLVYPGPQKIASDPPEATNDIQTLIQPALKNAPILEPPVALPNLVLLADAGLAPPPRPLPSDLEAPEDQPKSEAPAPLNVSTVVAAAALPLKPAQLPDFVVTPPRPTVVAAQGEAKPAPEKPEPEKAAGELPKAEAASAAFERPGEARPAPAVVPASGSDVDTVVALTPIPSTANQPATIPAGEARGRFAISPKPNLAGKENDAPSILRDAARPVVLGIESPPSSAVTVNQSAGDPPASVSISFGPGPAVKDEASGVGTAAAPASGPKAGPAKSSFAGISVTGGIDDAAKGANTSFLVKPRRPLQTSYGVSVVSTESSGGGLPSFGLFSNHDIYTVYIDMRETETDSDPPWTLEVAVAQDPGLPANAAKDIAAGKGLVLPFPAAKKQPPFPVELASRYMRKMIVVYGVINVAGKMEQLSVKQTPDPVLGEAVLAALGEWVFRPAARNGTPFPVKVLLGIPLWLRDLASPPRHVSISTTPPS